jgi:hypothetical protein
MSRKLLAVFGFCLALAFAAGAISVGGEKHAFAQTEMPLHALVPTESPPPLSLAATSTGTASSAWIVDPTNHKIVFCRQIIPTGVGEQTLRFSCKSQPLP